MMQEIIAHLEKKVHATDAFDATAFRESLDIDSCLHWKTDFPVGVIHHKQRMDASAQAYFAEKSLLDAEGYTPNIYTIETLNALKTDVPQALKRVWALCHEKECDLFRYEPKYPDDKWKKLVDTFGIRGVVTLSLYDETMTPCLAESQLRDLMRSCKEVPSLKTVPFVWMAVLPSDKEVGAVLRHYFGDCYIDIEKGTSHICIGWHERLGEVNMRHFVCPPSKEKQ